ncbi:MAG TPA: hypothetical protein ENI81_11370 [Phycisphaerales bacterium]|nr:hypothetical protein [Phycisphaerales bacterium]
MDAYKRIEERMAAKYGKSTTTRKAVGDFMLADDHAVNVKSNSVAKQNYDLDQENAQVGIRGAQGAQFPVR